jgi:hypothetical protein
MRRPVAHRSALAFVVSCAVSIPCILGAQAPGAIRIRTPAGRIEAQAGSAWKTAVVVTNQATTRVRLMPRIQLPSGWRPLLAPEFMDVAAGESNLLMLSAILPPTAGAATYPVIVDLQNDRGLTIRRDTLNVYVPERRSLKISGAAGPRFARVDTAITVDFLVRNDGNVAMTVDLRTHAVDASAVVRDSSRMAINAGGVRYVAVVVGPTARRGTQVIDLQARAGGASTFTGSFEVLRVAEAPVNTMVLPLNFRMRASQNDVTPAELSGGIAGLRDTFELMIRRPGETGIPFGERDEYRARWSGSRGRVLAGDMVPAANPIRDSYEMLTGVDATAFLGRLTANTYAGRDRLLKSRTSEAGASLGFRPLRSFLLGVGGMQRTGADSGEGPVWRAFTSIGRNPIAPLLRAEVNSGKEGIDAYGARVQHRAARGWVDLSAADLAPTAAARERGSSRASVSLGARLTRLLSVRAWGSQYEMDTLPGRPYAFSSKNYAAGFNFGPVLAEYRRDEREAFIQGVSYTSQEESGRANIGHAFGRATMAAGAEIGQSHDPTLSEESAPFQRYTGSAYLTRSARWSAGASLEYYIRKAFVTTEHYSGSVSASARIANTRIEVDGSVFHVLFPTIASYSTLNARLEHAIGSTGQTLALRARAFSTTSGTPVPHPVVFFVEYGMPFEIPLPGVGARPVRARVVEAGSGRSVAGALVRMGDYTAITNADGRLTFAPTDILNQLTVERSNVSSPMVVDAPELAEARSGKTRDVTISVGEGARIIGRVSRYDRVTRDSIAATGGIADAEVTLSRGADTVRAVTKADGNFDFRQLPSGSWKVSVTGGQLPAAYAYERTSTTVITVAGGSTTVEFRVLSRTTEILLQDGGSLSLPKPDAKPDAKPGQPGKTPR